MTNKKRHPFVFSAYSVYPPILQKKHNNAPIDKFESGHIYYLEEKETEGCPWWRWADGYDLRYRVIHQNTS